MHHGVRITDGALVAAATLSNRYITDRFLPHGRRSDRRGRLAAENGGQVEARRDRRLDRGSCSWRSSGGAEEGKGCGQAGPV